MGNRSHVRMAGPLASHTAGFEQYLAEQGYRSAATHLYMMAQLSCWLLKSKLGLGDLSALVVEDFLRWRRAVGYRSVVSFSRLSQLIDYLVSIGVVASFEPAVAETPGERLIERYRCYLINERGLTTDSVRAYLEVAGTFLSAVSPDGELSLKAVSTPDVTRFVLGECQRMKVASAKVTTTRLRSLLRFLYVEGITVNALADAVPSVASWRLGSLPKALPPSDVTRLLKSCDRRTAMGRRDFAVLTMLSRLGLRAGEVAGLQLGDINWRAGEFTVRGKGHRTDQLPLPVEVGEAIVVWLQRGRPTCPGQSVFVRARAPHRALSSTGISAIVRHACERAGVVPVGAHRLRHSAATSMLRAGSSLDQVGQVLRHQRRETTSIYAKVDRRALSAVIRPWPGARP
ncbi:MAG: site-specific integrase [Candidatus Dormibacteria bacterium]|nr:site-specific integrase [Actinomycetota bacterium]